MTRRKYTQVRKRYNVQRRMLRRLDVQLSQWQWRTPGSFGDWRRALGSIVVSKP